MFDRERTELFPTICQFWLRFNDISIRSSLLNKQTSIAMNCPLIDSSMFLNHEIIHAYAFLAMPDPNGWSWFIHVAKLFSSTSNEFDIFDHARRLNIPKGEDLIECLEGTSSSTVRQIIKLLYSPKQLLKMRGTEVPADRRKAIRGMFYLDHQMGERMFYS